jgi:hypothetical protein
MLDSLGSFGCVLRKVRAKLAQDVGFWFGFE